MRIYWVGPKNQLIGRKPSTRNGRVKARLYGCGDLLPRETVIGDQTIVNSSRETLATLENPGVRANFSKLCFNSSPRTRVRPYFSLPFTTPIFLDGLRPAKNPNPRGTKGIPNFLGLLRSHGYREGIFGENVYRTQGSNIV